MSEEKLLKDQYTVKAVAEALGKSESTVYRYIEEGYLPAYKFPGKGGTLVILKADFEQFVSSRRV